MCGLFKNYLAPKPEYDVSSLEAPEVKFYIARNRRNVYRNLVGWGGKCG